MTISAIHSTFVPVFQDPVRSTNNQKTLQQVQSEFHQLGQDLQAGNLSQAQQDFATLAGNFPNLQQDSHSSGHVGQAAQQFNALEQALQGGDLAGAQTAFTAFAQDFQRHVDSANSQPLQGPDGIATRPHSNPLIQTFDSLSQALQGGNLAAARSAFAALQQDFQQRLFAASNFSNSNGNSRAPGTALNVTA